MRLADIKEATWRTTPRWLRMVHVALTIPAFTMGFVGNLLHDEAVMAIAYPLFGVGCTLGVCTMFADMYQREFKGK